MENVRNSYARAEKNQITPSSLAARTAFTKSGLGLEEPVLEGLTGERIDEERM
jgi:hypothetical protein